MLTRKSRTTVSVHLVRVGLAALAFVLAGCATTAVDPDAPPAYRSVSGVTEFDRLVRKSAKPVLCVFHSLRCAYCRATLTTQLPALAATYGSRLDITAVDITANRDLAAEFGVSGVPVLVFFAAGQEVKRLNGYRPQFMLNWSVSSFMSGRP